MENRKDIVKRINVLSKDFEKKIPDGENQLVVAGALYQAFMRTIGIELDENSRETAFRVAKMMLEERCIALSTPPPSFTVFPEDSYDEYIVVKDIPYYSMCSHHHVTFFGKVHVCYFPRKKILGLSKIARVVSYFAAKPQIQEQLTEEICGYIWKKLNPNGIMVKVEGRHMCMESRGAKAVGAITITQKVMGKIDKFEAEGLLA